MKSVAELRLAEDQLQILNSVMPGGENWNAFVESGGDCLNSCPYYSRCGGNGPDKVCSERWLRAEPNPNVLGVILHVLNNFEYYNHEDKDIPKGSLALGTLKLALEQAQVAQTDSDIEEGTPRMRMHRYRERNSAAAQQVKLEAISQGKLVCRACDIDFLERYPKAATRVVECHHSVPLSSNEHDGKTRKKDLWLLCANCHRLAHSVPDPLPLDELRNLVRGADRYRFIDG